MRLTPSRSSSGWYSVFNPGAILAVLIAAAIKIVCTTRVARAVGEFLESEGTA
jgi:hypothetical protein